MTWQERLIERAGSNRKAADLLFPEWRKKARKEVDREQTTPQALANRLGTLRRKGDPTGWWNDRPVLRQLVADFLDLEVDEIFEAHGGARAPAFREFPALPPLERDESPCRTSRAGSVFDLARVAISGAEQVRHWIVAPPGGGKSLAIELLRARFPGELHAQTIVRLGEAVALARANSGRPIVVELEESDPANDLTSVDALETHRASIVVLAPFGHPDERNGGWRTSHAALDEDWIARFLAWVDVRLASSPRDSKFDKDEVLAWLVANPSPLRAIQSPGDLLALCADFDAYGSEGSAQERAERWLRSIGVKALPVDAPRSWSTYAAANCVAEMFEAHALDRSTALTERSFVGWSALAPPSAPSSENSPGSEPVVGYLRAAGLLREDVRGVTAFPKWVAGALAQRRLVQLVKARDVGTWGAVAGDASRQFLIDDALNALTPNELRGAGEALLARTATQTVGFADVAALEAVVATLGRRLALDRVDRRDADLAKRALVRQLEYLVSGLSFGECRVPTTRRDRDEWFLSGWAISLATNDARIDVPKDLRWALPGWAARLRLSEAEPLNHIPWSSTQPWGASVAVQALAELTPKVVARLVDSVVLENCPRLLLPALFLADGWEVTHTHFAQLAGSWEESLLADDAHQLEPHRREALAQLLWRFASEGSGASTPAPVAARINYLLNRHEPLARFVLDNLPAAAVEETARTGGTHREQHSGGSYTPSDPRILRQLNAEQRGAAVRGRLASEVRFDEARELVEVLDGEDLDLLLDLVRAADRNVAAEFANRVWRVLPERAEAEAQRAFDDEHAAAEAWFRVAPRARIGALIEIVNAARTRPHWVPEWALVKLLDAGVHAESLFQLTRAGSPDTATASPRKPRKRVKRPTFS